MRYKPSRARRARPKALREGSPAPERLVTTSLRLRAGLRASLENLAVRDRRSVSDVAQQLLEEAVRLQECPGIYFADEPSGRTAKIMGTGLGVWEVVRDDLAVEQQDDRLREIFPFLTTVQIAAARNYALRFRDEIDQRIAAASVSPEEVRARYPGLVSIVRVP
jgi:uncharacterized protein (DUF433 family)